MLGKNNFYMNQKKSGRKFEKYSIKKLKVGAASVLVGAGFFLGFHVEASEVNEPATNEVVSSSPKDQKEKVSEAPKVVAEIEEKTNQATPSVDNQLVEEKNTNVATEKATPVEEKTSTIVEKAEQPTDEKKAIVETSKLVDKMTALQEQVDRVRSNEKQKSLVEKAEKLLEEAKALQKSSSATQPEVDAKTKEISSLTSILKSIKGVEKKEVSTKNEATENSTATKEGLKKLADELTEAVSKVVDLSSENEKKTIAEARDILKEVQSFNENQNETELVKLYQKVQKSRNSIVNLSTRAFSGKRDVRNGKEIPKEDLRADASVSNDALYGHLSFLDSNGVNKNISEDTIPVVSDGDGKRVLKLQLGFSSSSATPIKNGKIRYIIPKKHLNTDVKPTLSNSALASESPKDLSDENNYIYEIPLNTITGGAVGQINIEQQISSSIDKSPSAGDTTIARAEFYNGDELISTTTATAKYEYLSQILYKESDKKENKNLFDYVPGYYDRDLIIGSKNSDGTFSPIKGNTFTLPFITYNNGKDFLQGTDLDYKNGNGRLTDVDYTITGIPEFLELVPTVETNRYWKLEGNVAKLNYDKTSVDEYKRPTRVGAQINNNGPVFRVKEGYFDTPQKMEQYLSSNGGKKINIEYKAIGHRPDGSTYTQTLATSEALNNQLKFSIGDDVPAPIPAQRMGTGVTTPNKQRLFSNQSDTDEFYVHYAYNSGPLRDASGAMTLRSLKGNGDKLDNNYFVYSVPTDKPNTYFTHFQLTETHANVIQKDGTTKLEYYNSSEASKQSFNYKFAKPFKLYGVKADGTREELKEMSTADQLYEKVEIDKSKQFTRLVLEHPDIADKFIEAGDNYVPLGFRSTVRTTMANWQEMAANDNITRHENTIGVSLSTNGNSLDAATKMSYPAKVEDNGYNIAVHTKERFTAGLAISPVLPYGAPWGASYNPNRGSDKNNITRQQIVPFIVRYTAPEYYNNAIKTVDGKKVLNSEDLDEKIQNATVMLVADSALPLTNFRMPMDNKMLSNKHSSYGMDIYSSGDYEEVVKDTDVINPDKIIKNYKGTGKTAYIFKAKDLGLKSVDLNLNWLNSDGPVALTFEVVNNGQAENGTYHIDSYLVWDKASQRLVGNDPSLSADILEGHEPGRQVVKATTDVTLKVASEYYTQLTIAKKNEVGVMGIINVKNGEDVVLNPSVVNAADAPAVLKEVMVEIPKNYGEPHKVAETSLKGPIPGTAHYHVEYTTSKGTNAEKTVAPYVRADQITDWSTVTAVKYVFDKEYVLNKGEKFQTSFDVNVHTDNPNLVEGQSQVWLKDGKNTWLESNKVGLITEDQRGKLKVKHVNLSGNNIMSETTDKGFQDDPYTTSSYGIIDRANDGKAYIYSHVHSESDPTDGIYEKQKTKKVIYVYVEADREEERKDVTRTINYVEKDNEGNVIFPQRTYRIPVQRAVYTIKEGPRKGEKIYGPWQRLDYWLLDWPLDLPTEVSPTGNNDYTLVGRKDDETIKNVEKEPILTWKAPNGDIQVDPVTGKVTIAADKVKAGTEISAVTKYEYNTLTNVSSTDDAGNKVISPLASATTRLEITYIPKGQKEPITSIVTKEGGRWTTTDTNLTLNADSGEVTISKDKREFGQNVTIVAKDSNGNSTTLPAISNKKDAVIRPVIEASTMYITYTPAGQDTPVTVTVSKEIIENKEYTVLYEAKKGSININYEDTEGHVIKPKQAYVSEQKLKNATDVDGTELTGPNKSSFSMGALQGEKREKFRPDKITLEDGKIYNLRRVKPDTPWDYGDLVEGTTEITYVYELAKGTVRVKYQDTDGSEFGLADKVIKDNVPTGEAYDTTTSENKPTRYETADGKVYELVKVAKTEGNVQYDANGVRTDVNPVIKAEPSGTVAEGYKEITYIYELKKGSVVVHYIDTEGNKIKDDRTDKDNVTTGTQYNVTDATNKPVKITTAEGKVFELVTEAKTEGEVQYDATGVKKDSAAVKGRVKAETLEVTYVYKEKKSGVTVKYVDSQGRPIAGTATMPGDTTETVTTDGLKPVTDASVNSDYNVENKKASKITTADGKVYRLIADRDGLQAGSKPATGKVEENEITVTYQYELLGSVVTKYELSDGTKLTGELTFDNATTPTTVEEKGLAVANATDVSNGTNYDASTPANKPNKITTATGEVYYLTTANTGVKADSAPVTGTVEEGKTKEVTYVYEKAGSVVIKYINTDGTEIKTSVQDSTNVKAGTDYNAAENDEKPATIEFNNKKYKLVTQAGTTTTNATYSAEAVVTNGENVGAATGQVVSGKTLEVTYVYEEVKGNVIVKFQDIEGNKIAEDENDETNASLTTNYNTSEHKKATIVKDGITYYLTDKVLKDGSKPEEGPVVEGTTEVTYVYEKAGSVIVNYQTEDGMPLVGTADGANVESGAKDTTDAKAGTDYNTADNGMKPNRITTAEGKVYELVPTATKGDETGKVVAGETKEVTYVYKEVKGNVVVKYEDTQGNVIAEDEKDETDASLNVKYDTADHKKDEITKDGVKYYLTAKEIKDDSKPATGDVVEGKTNVTYVYEKAGSVIVNYQTEDGTPLVGTADGKDVASGVKDTDNGKPGSEYNTADNGMKPTRITTAEGKVYELVPASTKGDETGTVEAGQTKEVTYVYKEITGNVVVHYVDTEGNTLAPDTKDVENGSLSDKYDTTDNKPAKLEKDGVVYHLTAKALKDDSKPENGDVVEGKTEVTYVYKEVKGNVVVKYEDTEGNTLADDEKDETDASLNVKYDTADHKKDEITKDGVKYYLTAKELKDGSKPATGDVVEGTTTVTYVYEKAGQVVVNYQTEDGTPLVGTADGANVASGTKDTVDGRPGSDYDTSDNGMKPNRITTTEGKVYGLVPTATKGDETGKVVAGKTLEVTYVYEVVKGNVTVTYKDTQGKTIEGYETPKDAEKDAPTGKDFNTATDALKPSKITTKDGKVYNLVPTRTEGNEKGKVTENPQNVTYVYELAKGDVTVTYKDTEGKTIEGYETPKDAEKAAPTGKDFNTATEALKPSKITTPSGKVYNLVPARTEGTESGKVTEEPQNVTYVYELAKGNVTVTYKDTEGNKIPGYETPKTVETQSPTGKEYTTVTEALKPTKITTKDGKVYNLVPTRTEGNEKGKVTENPQNVTYVYELAKGNVTVTYKDTEGNTIEGYETPRDAEKDAPTGKGFNTATDALKPSKITTPSGKVYKLVPARTEGNESGKVTEKPQNVTYVYEEVKEPKVPTKPTPEAPKPTPETPNTDESKSTIWKSVDGETLKPRENGTKDKSSIPGYEFVRTEKDKEGNTVHIYRKVTSSTPEVKEKETSYVDENGKEIRSTKKGKQPKENIPGYEFVRTEEDSNGNVRHVYRQVVHSESKVDTPTTVEERKNELPNTGTGNEFTIFGAAAASILAGLGIAIPGKKKED